MSKSPPRSRTGSRPISPIHEQEPSAPELSASQDELPPPPLPPRRKRSNLELLGDRPRSSSSPLMTPTRPPLSGNPTTALSRPDVHTLAHDGTRHGQAAESRRASFSLSPAANVSGQTSDDAASIRSFAPTLEAGGDTESLIGEVLADQTHMPWRPLSAHIQHDENLFPVDPDFDPAFEREFDELDELEADGSNQDVVLQQWRGKLKHFLILSSAGKPIYSRHGDDQLVTNYIGIIQTLISFYQGSKDSLRGFTAGDARFVVITKGPLHLLAISRFGESDAQLRAQLDSLYMQILSTLTLPKLEHMFANRPGIDLRKPLQGTESLLSALSDGFTRGSPSTLLSALECLKLRKAHRHAINNTLLKVKCPSLLYGLIVAGGRLVSVIRPKKHSLHPGDLHLIFNMLFEAGSVKAGGGENWIPLCLPGFNNTGYLYMYVSFLELSSPTITSPSRPTSSSGKDDEIAIILISPHGESFDDLRHMRDDLVSQLESNGSMDLIRTALSTGRASCTDIVPGTALRHFLYKSRANVQFTLPSYTPHYNTPLARRKLLKHYGQLHANLHARPTPMKLLHTLSPTVHSISWITPVFELYAVAPATTSRAALAAAANKVVAWAKREEARIFIIGGGVF